MMQEYLNKFTLQECLEFYKKRAAVVIGDGVIVAITGVNEDPHDVIISRERRLKNETS